LPGIWNRGSEPQAQARGEHSSRLRHPSLALRARFINPPNNPKAHSAALPSGSCVRLVSALYSCVRRCLWRSESGSVTSRPGTGEAAACVDPGAGSTGRRGHRALFAKPRCVRSDPANVAYVAAERSSSDFFVRLIMRSAYLRSIAAWKVPCPNVRLVLPAGRSLPPAPMPAQFGLWGSKGFSECSPPRPPSACGSTPTVWYVSQSWRS
jgi:hypothetical protein